MTRSDIPIGAEDHEPEVDTLVLETHGCTYHVLLLSKAGNHTARISLSHAELHELACSCLAHLALGQAMDKVLP